MGVSRHGSVLSAVGRDRIAISVTQPTEAPLPERDQHPLIRHRVVLAIATVTAVLTGPGQTIGVSVFIDPMRDELGISRSQIGTAYLIGTLIGSLAMPFVGRFVDRNGVRMAQVIVGVLFAGALVNMSLVTGFVWLAVGFTGIRMLGQGSLSMISTVTVQLRFTKSRGLAIAIFAMVSGALMALVPLGLNSVISAVGWRETWLVAAAIVALSVVPLGWFGLRSVPKVAPDDHVVGDRLVRPSLDRGAALRTSGFWALAAMSATTAMLSTALNFHQIDLLGEAGLSRGAAAAMFLPQIAGGIIAGFIVGGIADRVGSRFLPAASMVLLAIVHLLGAFVVPGGVVVLYAFLLGATGGAVRTIAATLLPDWFGTSHIGSIQGSLTLINVAGSALGPIALAVLDERLNGYRPALLVLFWIPAVIAVGSSFVRPPAFDVPSMSS